MCGGLVLLSLSKSGREGAREISRCRPPSLFKGKKAGRGGELMLLFLSDSGKEVHITHGKGLGDHITHPPIGLSGLDPPARVQIPLQRSRKVLHFSPFHFQLLFASSKFRGSHHPKNCLQGKQVCMYFTPPKVQPLAESRRAGQNRREPTP